jgi:hypothetical protein
MNEVLDFSDGLQNKLHEIRSRGKLQDRLGNSIIFEKQPIFNWKSAIPVYEEPVQLITPDVFKYEIHTPTISLSGLGVDFWKDAVTLSFHTSSIKSHLLGILKLPHLRFIDRAYEVNIQLLSGIVFGNEYEFLVNEAQQLSSVLNIIQKYLGLKNILACQEELIDNGFKDYADL